MKLQTEVKLLICLVINILIFSGIYFVYRDDLSIQFFLGYLLGSFVSAYLLLCYLLISLKGK